MDTCATSEQRNHVAPRSPGVLMTPRRLGALPSNRLSAARSFVRKMTKERWKIELHEVSVDRNGNGTITYRVETPTHVFTVPNFCREPRFVNRTPRIIGSSWDMEGAIIEGEPNQAYINYTRNEMPKLYAGRACPGTLIWFRSNQSTRLFTKVRQALSKGEQPDTESLRSVGYLMRNTGLDGNGTFGTRSFNDYETGHPLAIPYHAQMLAAYIMREFAVDLVEELARKDSPNTAVALDLKHKRELAIGNGSALGLVLFAFNRPKLINAWLTAYERTRVRVQSQSFEPTDPALDKLDELLEKAKHYRNRDLKDYTIFPRGPEIASDIQQIQRQLRGVRAQALRDNPHAYHPILNEVARIISSEVTPEAEEIFYSLLLELDPDFADAQIDSLTVDEIRALDPEQTCKELNLTLETEWKWCIDYPLEPESMRNRRWYKSRASEEPRSGPLHELPPDTVNLIPDIINDIRRLRTALKTQSANDPVVTLVAHRPDLEAIATTVQSISGLPYAVPHTDLHSDATVPAYLIHLLNAFCFGLDTTVDLLNRSLRGLILEGAPTRTEIQDYNADWWWTTSPERQRLVV